MYSLWVWAVLCYLVFVGVQALRPHVVYIPKLLLIPTVLIGMQYKILLSDYFNTYFGFLCVGVMIGIFLTLKSRAVVNQKNYTVSMPGSGVTLFVLLSFFIMKYTLGYLQAQNVAQASNYLLINIGLSALFSGYLLGRAVYFVSRLYRVKV